MILAFITSLLSSILIIRLKKKHERFSADWDFSGPQRFHKKIIPRIGGVSIILGLLASIIDIYYSASPQFNLEIIFIACSIPAFAIGLTEDITKKISIRSRLICTAFGAILIVNFAPLKITSLGIPHLDIALTLPVVSAVITVFAITGLANAYNIIDGFNGLSSMVGLITLAALYFIGLKLNDLIIMHLSLVMIFAILGFFFFNYPRGLIFLGDGGAYLIGFWIASLSVLLIDRHREISPWFALLINGYPTIETLFTIYRRKIHQGKSPGQPDGIHFHTLIYRRILRQYKYKNITSANAKTAPYLWIFSTLSIIPALVWSKSTPSLIAASIVFTIVYVFIYKKIVRFKTPRWMHFFL